MHIKVPTERHECSLIKARIDRSSIHKITSTFPALYVSVLLSYFFFKGQELVKICGISLSIKKTATLEGCMKVCVCPGTLDDSVAAEYGYSGICYACDLWDMGL